MSVVSLHDSMASAEPTPILPPSSSSSSLSGKATAFCQEEKNEEEEEVKKVAVEETKKTKNPIVSFSSSALTTSAPACCDSMRRSPILTNSGSSSSSSSPSTDEEGEGDDENNDYSALIKRFFIDEHASFRVAGNGAQLDDVPPSGSNPSLYLQDSVETRLGSLKFELEKEFQSNHHNDDSFEGLVRRFKIDPYSSNMRSPLPAAPTTRRSSVQPSPFPGHYSPPRSPSAAAPVMTPFSPFSSWTPLDLSSLRARSHNVSSSSSRSRSRSRSVSRSRAAEDRSSQPVSSLDQVLHKRVRSGRVSRFPKKHRRQQQQQQQQQRSKKQQQQQPSQEEKQAKPKVLHRNANQFRGPRALFSPKSSPQKKKQQQQQQAQAKAEVKEQPQLPRPRKLELLQSTQRLMSIFRPPVTSSVW